MRLFPSRVLELPDVLRLEPSLVEGKVLAAHVVKHVLGIATSRKRGPWDAEGFSQVDPPIIDERRRAEIFALLGQPLVACQLPEARGKRGVAGEPECYECSRAAFCAPHLDAAVGGYLALAEGVLAEFEGGIRLPAREVMPLLVKHRAHHVRVEDCATLVRYQTLGGVHVVRATRVRDGIRAELAMGPRGFRFRTVYRIPGPPLTRLSAALATGGEGGVSDWVTLPRPLAEACGFSPSSSTVSPPPP